MNTRHRTAAVVRIELESPLEELRPDPRHDSVLLIVSVAGRVVGQVFVDARGVLTPEDQWEAIATRLAEPVMRGVVGARLATAARADGGDEPSPRMRVAVAICTRQRAGQLEECLAGVARLRTRPAEVIVVDNTDGDPATAEVCRRHGAGHVVEPVAGQTRARNRALLETDAELVAFTDDDCVVDEGWLDDIGRSFSNPMVMCVTGYLGPLELETPAQYLFERHGGFERRAHRVVYDIGRIQPQRGAAVAGAGANMVFRRAVFAEIGNFAEDLGPGTPARSADDKYQFYRVLAAGYRIVYEPQRIVWHRHRREMRELRRIVNDYGTAEFAYSTRCLLRHRELTAFFVYAWWLRHIAGHVKRALLPGPNEIPVLLALEELRGVLAGPRALAQSVASRRGIPPLPPPAAEEPARRARVAVEPPELSVAISTFNRRDALRRCLEGLCEQDLDADRYEVIVVVDGSTDGSAQMARGLDTPYATRVFEQPNSGVAVGRNRGAEEARHPIVVFLDDDIEALPGTLAAHAAAHAAAPEPHYALGYYPPAQPPDTLWAAIVRLWWEDHFRRKDEPGHQWTFLDIVDGNSSIHVRQLFEVGAYDERFGRGRRQDYELGIRILAREVPVRFHRATHALHHLDVGLAAAFRNAREEGRSDVMLATIHPRVKGRLPLTKIAERARDTRSAAVLGTGPPGLVRSESTISVIRALERVRLRRRAIWLLNRGLVRDYALGAADACGGAEALKSFLADIDEGRASASVRLDAPARVTLPRDPEPVDLQLTYRDRPVATVEAMPPHRQWDWDELAERLEGEAAEPLALRLAVDALFADELALRTERSASAARRGTRPRRTHR